MSGPKVDAERLQEVLEDFEKRIAELEDTVDELGARLEDVEACIPAPKKEGGG